MMRAIIFFTVVTAFVIGSHWYLYRRLVSDLEPSRRARRAGRRLVITALGMCPSMADLEV